GGGKLMAQVQRTSAAANSKDIISILKKDGCIVLEDLLSAKELANLQSDLQYHFDKTPDCQGDFYGYATKRMSSLFTKSKVCRSMALKPAILAVMDEFL